MNSPTAIVITSITSFVVFMITFAFLNKLPQPDEIVLAFLPSLRK
jgi:hypothetical protein